MPIAPGKVGLRSCGRVQEVLALESVLPRFNLRLWNTRSFQLVHCLAIVADPQLTGPFKHAITVQEGSEHVAFPVSQEQLSWAVLV